MKSKWFEYKEAAVSLRKTGMSMTVIERKLGIPRSTLSGWFRHVPISEEKRLVLLKSKRDGWEKARKNAVLSHQAQKIERLLTAENEAKDVLNQLLITGPLMDLALAMLYLGEGSKGGSTSLASSDPKILNFMLKVLELNYSTPRALISCELHLRMDQDPDEIKAYWAEVLNIPIEMFKYVAFDKRSSGKPTYSHYKGVCVLQCGNIAIQRKLVYLYTLFCEKISEL